MTFKVGDKVRCICDDSYSYIKKGEVDVINSINSYSHTIGLFSRIQYGSCYTPSDFELVNPKNQLDEQIIYAKTLIGKKVYYKEENKAKEVKNVFVSIDVNEDRNSLFTKQHINTHGVVVAVETIYGTTLVQVYPIEDITLAPEFEELKLNDSYTAKIFKDKIEVGCQTFTPEIIETLYKLTKKN